MSYARFSLDGWLGVRVIIMHGSGLKTSHSHLSGIFEEEGEKASPLSLMLASLDQ